MESVLVVYSWVPHGLDGDGGHYNFMGVFHDHHEAAVVLAHDFGPMRFRVMYGLQSDFEVDPPISVRNGYMRADLTLQDSTGAVAMYAFTVTVGRQWYRP